MKRKLHLPVFCYLVHSGDRSIATWVEYWYFKVNDFDDVQSLYNYPNGKYWFVYFYLNDDIVLDSLR